MNDVMQTILTILGSVLGGGGIVSLFYFKYSRRVKAAEAKAAEVANELKIAQAWENIAKEYDAKVVARDNKIDRLYGELSEWRDKYNKAMEELAETKVKQITLLYKCCEKRGCPQREPETGY